MSEVWIVVVNYNGRADTRLCLESLAKLPPTGVRFLVVDNGSTPNPVPELRGEFPWCEFLRNDDNQGWAGGNDRGIEYALARGAGSVLLLNNDAIVAPNLIERLTAAAAAHPEFGVLGPVVRDMDPPQNVQTDGYRFGDPNYDGFWSRQPVELKTTEPPTVAPTDVVMGCCLWIRADVFAKIGCIDERFFLIHEETDFCLRAAAAGFGVGILAEDLCWHRLSASFGATGKPWKCYYDARNLWLLLSKHRPRPGRDRGRWNARKLYLKHMYYYWSAALDAGDRAGAEAILAGMADGFVGRFGPYVEGARWLAAPMRWGFAAVRWLKRTSGGRGWTDRRSGSPGT